MAFKFNFAPEAADERSLSLDMHKKCDDDDVTSVEIGNTPALQNISCSAEVKLSWDSYNYQISPSAHYELSDGTVLECVLPANDETNSLGSVLFQNVAVHTDLLPNVYEGGFKVWECCVDLSNFLAQQNFVFKDKTVLELGCGAGLPGIYALLCGSVVHFQDYNEEVLHKVTVPSIIVNVRRWRLSWPPNCRFFRGDWDSLADAVASSAEYDFIFTSETVYSQASYHKLHSVMEALLKQDGEIYVAAKTCYFGVGGGSQDFATFVQHCSVFNVKVVRSVTTGVQREILKLTFKTTVSSKTDVT